VSSASSTPRAKREPAKQPEQAPPASPPRGKRGIVYVLFFIWFCLIGFAVFGAFESLYPEWFTVARDRGKRTEAKSVKDYADDYMRKGEYTKAIPLYMDAMRIDPNFIDAIVNRAVAHSMLGEHDQADLLFRDGLARVTEHNGLIWAQYGDALRRQGKRREAIAALTKAYENKIDTPVVLLRLAELYLDEGQLAEARQVAELGLQRTTDPNAQWEETLNLALEQNAQEPEVLAKINGLIAEGPPSDKLQRFDVGSLRLAANRQPVLSDLNYILGVVAQRQGSVEEARKRFEQALRHLSRNDRAKKALSELK